MFDNQAELANAQAKFGFLNPEDAVAGSLTCTPVLKSTTRRSAFCKESPFLKECKCASA